MATIVRHPEVEDYFVELTLDEIRQRPHGIIPEYEANRLIILKEYRLPVDLAVFAEMSTNLALLDDPALRRSVKKMESTTFFGPGRDPVQTKTTSALRRSVKKMLSAAFSGLGRKPVQAKTTSDAVTRALYDVLCKGDAGLYRRASEVMRAAHDALLSLYSVCFPQYGYFKLVPTIRFTQTLFENLHWDNHHIAEDFQQARIFCNLDQRPRLWNVSHNFVTYAQRLYREHELSRFAGQDPNLLVNYLTGNVLGGSRNACRDSLARHVIAFEPGEVWFGESRMLSHQIVYGERAMVYMFFVEPSRMLAPEKRFNTRVEALHRENAHSDQ